MALSLTHSNLPYPVRKARYSVLVEYRDSAQALTNPTSPDSEFSIDGSSFTDCAEEVSPTAGYGYLTLSGAETDNPAVKVQCKGTGVLTSTFDLYPRDLPILLSGTAAAGGNSTITLPIGSSAVDDCYNGLIVRTTGGTGGGGTGGASNQARVILDYVGSTRVATISGTWETNPSSDTTFDLLVTPEWLTALNTRALLALPAVAAAASGGLPTLDANGLVQSDIARIGGVVQSLTDLKDFADTGYDPATHRARANLEEIMTAALTESAGSGKLRDAFVKAFNVTTPEFASSDWTATRASLVDQLNGATDGTVAEIIKTCFTVLSNRTNNPNIAGLLGIPDTAAHTLLADLEGYGDGAWATATGFELDGAAAAAVATLNDLDSSEAEAAALAGAAAAIAASGLGKEAFLVTRYYDAGTVALFRVFLRDNSTPANNPVTGETVTLAIRRMSDGKWYRKTDSWVTFATYAAVNSDSKIALIDNSDGSYSFQWDQFDYDGGVRAEYELYYEVTSEGAFEGQVMREVAVFQAEGVQGNVVGRGGIWGGSPPPPVWGDFCISIAARDGFFDNYNLKWVTGANAGQNQRVAAYWYNDPEGYKIRLATEPQNALQVGDVFRLPGLAFGSSFDVQSAMDAQGYSSGRAPLLDNLAGLLIASGTVGADPAPTTTTFVTGLELAADTNLKGATVSFTEEPLLGVQAGVASYNSATDEITLDEALDIAPAKGAKFDLRAIKAGVNKQQAVDALALTPTPGDPADGSPLASLTALNTRALLALPAVAPAGSGGLPTLGTGAGQISPDGSTGAVPAVGLTATRAGYLDNLDKMVTLAGTATAGGASTITLTGGVAGNNAYRDKVVSILSGPGAGESGDIISYDGGTKIATMARAWVTQPTDASVFVVWAIGAGPVGGGATADEIWDEVLGGHVVAGSAAQKLLAAGGAFPGVQIIAGNANPIGTKFALGIVRGDDMPFSWQLKNALGAVISVENAEVTLVAKAEDVEDAETLWGWEGDVSSNPTLGWVTFSPDADDTTAEGIEEGKQYPAYLQIVKDGHTQTLLGTAEVGGRYVDAVVAP